MKKTTLVSALLFAPSVLFAQAQTTVKASSRVQTSGGSVEADAGMSARLNSARAALERGGHAKAQDQEVRLAARAMERGATDVQIESLARHAPADRSLAVSFNVLTTLSLRGVSMNDAVARVAAKLDANASDSAIASLVGSGGTKVTSPETNANAAVNATLGGIGGAAAGVSGSILKKP
jgi:hypothetical protein